MLLFQSALAKVPSKLTIAARERLTRVSEEILLRVLRTVNQRARGSNSYNSHLIQLHLNLF